MFYILYNVNYGIIYYIKEVKIMNRKTVVITGASKGIGRRVAEVLGVSGYNVVINYNKSHKEALEVREYIMNNGGQAEIYKADIGNYEEAKDLMNFALEKYNRIDGLINNAGISQIKLFNEISIEEWNEMIRVNLSGIFNCTQNVVDHMISNKSGKIINISSIWGMEGASCEVHYSTVKAGIIGFTKSLAKELGPSNIQVNCVAPGIVMTGMMEGFTDDEMKDMKEEIPLQRFGQVEDVVNVIEFFLSEKSDYITGQIISPNGGILI